MAENYPLVYCVILNLNGGDLLRETLRSVSNMTYPNFRILVVDNGSNDGSSEMVRKRFSAVELLENGENLGFGGGNNVGMKYALDKKAGWVFLLNNDITVDPEILSELYKVGSGDDSIGILVPKIYYHADPDKLWYAGGKVNFFTGMISHRGLREIDAGQYDRIEPTTYVTGCAMLFRRKVLEDVGMFDPVYHPIYSEDADLSERARRAGYKLVYVPKGRMWHKVSSFSGGGLTPFKTRLKVEHNMVFFKRYAKWYHWLTIPWCIGGIAVVFVVKELLSGNVKVVLALLGGFRGAIKRLIS